MNTQQQAEAMAEMRSKETLAMLKNDCGLGYAGWRWDAWMAGAGSYNEIDSKVASGDLTPFSPMDEQQWLRSLRESASE